MEPVEKLYNGRFFRSRHRLAWRTPYICDGIIEIMNLSKGDSIVDVGCAIGDIVAEFISLGYEAEGIEGSKDALHYSMVPIDKMTIHDMRTYINVDDFNLPYNIATCFEVAEHIEEKYAHILVFNLCTLSNIIIMSAAPPGVKGIGHVNCQSFNYWIKQFNIHNFIYEPILTNQLKARWYPWRKRDGIKAFYNHLMIFKRK